MLAAPPARRALPDTPRRLGQHQHAIQGAMMPRLSGSRHCERSEAIQRRKWIASSLTLLAMTITPASAQEPPPVEVDIVGGGVKSAITIAVPAMPGAAVGRDIAQVIASDLRSTGLFTPLGPGGIASYPQEQAAAPVFGEWRAAGASALVSG